MNLTINEKLQLIDRTLQQLLITQVNGVDIGAGAMGVHLGPEDMDNTFKHAKEMETHNTSKYPWQRIAIYNNIRFYAIYTQEEWDRRNG